MVLHNGETSLVVGQIDLIVPPDKIYSKDSVTFLCHFQKKRQRERGRKILLRNRPFNLKDIL